MKVNFKRMMLYVSGCFVAVGLAAATYPVMADANRM